MQEQDALLNVVDHEHEDARKCIEFLTVTVSDGFLGFLVLAARCYSQTEDVLLGLDERSRRHAGKIFAWETEEHILDHLITSEKRG